MENEFACYFSKLIRDKGFKNLSVFLVELCKTKNLTRTSFYDILNGRLIPSLERQQQIVDTLKLTDTEKIDFFDKLKKPKIGIPTDIVNYLYNNEKAIKKLREEMKNENTSK